MPKPEIINLSSEAVKSIKLRILESAILEDDKKILLSLLSTHEWLYRQLQSVNITLGRIKKFFGFSTEKRSKLKKPKDPYNIPPEQNSTTNDNLSALPSLTAGNSEVAPIKK